MACLQLCPMSGLALPNVGTSVAQFFFADRVLPHSTNIYMPFSELCMPNNINNINRTPVRLAATGCLLHFSQTRSVSSTHNVREYTLCTPSTSRMNSPTLLPRKP